MSTSQLHDMNNAMQYFIIYHICAITIWDVQPNMLYHTTTIDENKTEICAKICTMNFVCKQIVVIDGYQII